MAEQDCAGAKPLDLTNVVTHEQYRFPLALDHVFHAIEAFPLESQVTDREHFIDDEYVCVNTGGDARC